MTSAQIRQSFLDFFREKQHTIVPSSSLLPDSPNLLFTNAGMNQFVPIFLGQTACPYSPARAADTQKCIRAGGKHNDLEDVGLDTYHHTFFEMLGNWSFGDYFKKEAIAWAWELIVERWKFPPERLYATVYAPGPGDPSEFDSEAHAEWARLFTAAGLDPAVHIVNGDKKDNFWMMGETGPCGPCSELHVDLTPLGDTRGTLVNAGDARCIEIWNLVFIQFNCQIDRVVGEAEDEMLETLYKFVPLPAKHVDTGMGFERVCSIIQGTKNFTDFASAHVSNYETDIFRPIFDELESMSGKRYASTLPGDSQPSTINAQFSEDIAFRVIADHIRTLSFAIADGIQPGNTDRNYVLRRILRRAVKYGRTLGFHEPFFYQLVPVLAREMGDVFPELRAKQKHIEEVLKREEEAFNKTLDRGIELFDSYLRQLHDQQSGRTLVQGNWVENGSAFIGHFLDAWAFELYDTYGFPLDLTELMARERGLTVDTDGFGKLMEAQRARARAAQKRIVIELSEVETKDATNFLGYEHNHTGADVQEVLSVKGKTVVIANNSVCYAEMGGQVGDTGMLSRGADAWRIANTQKSGNTFLHFLEEADGPGVGDHVTIEIDRTRRGAIQRHHSVTHLLHWALHEVVSHEATQKGSFVGPEKLTFDFNSPALTPQQVRDVERLVNERILENAAVSWSEVPYAEVKGRADIMQFFGDKYGDTVRVVDIGGYSKELCAGTHARATGELGLFRIVSEAAVAAGVRRIEAVAGLAAYDRTLAETSQISALAGKIGAPIPDAEKKLEVFLTRQKELEKQLESLRQKQAAAAAQSLAARAEGKAIVEHIPNATGDELQAIAEALKGSFSGVVFLAGTTGGQVALVSVVSPEFTSKVQAGKLIQQAATIVGGKGGGRPDMARGAGKDASRIDSALAAIRETLAKTAA